MYLGVWIPSSVNDFEARMAIVCKLVVNLKKSGNQPRSRRHHNRNIQIAIETVLLYTNQTWTTRKQLKINKRCSMVIRMIMNIPRQDNTTHMTQSQGLS